MSNAQNIPNINFDQVSEGLSQILNLSAQSMKSMVDIGTQMMGPAASALNSLGVKVPALQKDNDDCGCCPPKDECPPQCLMKLTANAYDGERIIVPFSVRNTTGTAKVYKVGIRELIAQDGTKAPAQPKLNKTSISLQPGQSITVLMEILVEGFKTGTQYNADIVLREKNINQNICFTLNVDGLPAGPEARPIDEKKYGVHFQHWQDHYYCTPKPTPIIINPIVVNK